MLEKLRKEGYIKKIKTNPQKVEDSLELAKRDLKVAQKIINTNTDWAFNIAYNSILQSIRAVMFKKGYRPSSHNSHIAVGKFASTVLTKKIVYIWKGCTEKDTRRCMILQEQFPSLKLKRPFKGLKSF